MACLLSEIELGPCGLAQRDAGLTCVGLPEAQPQETEAQMRRSGGEPTRGGVNPAAAARPDLFAARQAS